MAKAVIAIITLVMLGVWGWLSWGEYAKFVEWDNALDRPKIWNAPTSLPRGRTDVVGFAKYVCGLYEEGTLKHEMDAEIANSQTNVRIALGVIVALSATMFFAVTGGSGTIFSVMITASVSFFAAAANMVFGLFFVGFVAWTAFDMGALDLSIGIYAMLLHSAILIVASFSAMRQLPGLVRGRRDPMKGVLKSLLVLAIVNGGLAPVGVVPQFEYGGFSGFYWLAGLCLLSLMFIGLTHSNFRYD
jgi:hypothetical protein